MENPHIKIKHVDGGNDKSYLKHCYFRETHVPNTFHFFQKDGTRIHTEPHPLSSGEDFTFNLTGNDGKERFFGVTEFFISEEGGAEGRWSVPPRDTFDEGDPETGTFQAPGGHPDELSAGASGSA